MKVYNYNDEFRNILQEEYAYANEEEIEEILEELKDDSIQSKYILGLLYESAILSCFEEYILASNSKEDLEQIEDDIDFLLNLNNINEFSNYLDTDNFPIYFSMMNQFNSADCSLKRHLLDVSLQYKNKISHIFPSYLIDIMHYLNKFDIDYIVDDYDERNSYNNKNAFYDTININSYHLFDLKQKDTYAFKYLLLEMMESFYKYNKYLSDQGYKNEKIEPILKNIENNFDETYIEISNNLDLVKIVMEGFLKYKLQSIETVDYINDYYEQNKINSDLVKVLRKSYKLKNNKINN